MRTSCRQYVESLELHPPLEGHLSRAHGFLAPEPTKARLPESHRLWEEVALELPRLFASNATQRILADLPVLSAEPDALADEDLTRASVVVSALGHAYWRFGVERFFPQRITQVPTDLPTCILEPWCGLARRLGRRNPSRPFQSFYDLFLANYRLAPHVRAGAPLVIENLQVLVPSFGNEAERIFYMSFVEMHHHFAPVVAALCDLGDGVQEQDASRVANALERIQKSFERATGVWNKISARRGSALYCDPVLWSKTAAILGVPPEGCVQGATSGACAPVLYLMDALLQRSDYSSHYGQFMAQQAGDMVASTVHELSLRVRDIPLAAFISEREGSSAGSLLRDAFAGVLESYCGRNGWLGRHAVKVFNYLCISTVTGRNASVSGHERYFGRQTWIEASSELHESRHERAAGSACPVAHHTPRPDAAPGHAPAALPARTDLPLFTRVEVARHHRAGDLWLVIDEGVYDVSTYAAKHPGGNALLEVYAGQDVSSVFWSQSVHLAAAIPRLLGGMQIGRVSQGVARWVRLYDVLYTLIRARQALALQYDHVLDSGALKLFSDENTHMMLWRENLPAAYEALHPGGWAAVEATPEVRALLGSAQSFSLACDFREPSSPELARAMARRCDTLARQDYALVDRLVLLAVASIDEAERNVEGPSVDELSRALAENLRAELLLDARRRAGTSSLPTRLEPPSQPALPLTS